MHVELPSKEDHPKIYIHNLAGFTTPKTKQIKCFFKNIPLTIFIDFGSTHNFIDPRIAKQEDYFVHPFSIFKGMIVNGGTLPCKGSVSMCVSLLEIITCKQTFFPCP